MTELLKLGGAMLGGVGLGALFFAGLWLTVQRGVCSQHPATLFAVSLLIRTILAVSGFYFLSRNDWRNLICSLVGFVVARTVMTRALGSSIQATPHLIEGGVR